MEPVCLDAILAQGDWQDYSEILSLPATPVFLNMGLVNQGPLRSPLRLAGEQRREDKGTLRENLRG